MILNKKVKNVYLEKIGLHTSVIFPGPVKNSYNEFLEKYHVYIHTISLYETTDITKCIELNRFSRLDTVNYYTTVDRHTEIYLEQNLPKLKKSGIRNVGLVLNLGARYIIYKD